MLLGSIECRSSDEQSSAQGAAAAWATQLDSSEKSEIMTGPWMQLLSVIICMWIESDLQFFVNQCVYVMYEAVHANGVNSLSSSSIDCLSIICRYPRVCVCVCAFSRSHSDYRRWQLTRQPEQQQQKQMQNKTNKYKSNASFKAIWSRFFMKFVVVFDVVY